MTIGIIAALHPETKILKKHLKFKETESSVFFCEEKDILLLQTGIGKKNVEKVLPEFFDQFSLDVIINIGSAGSLDSSLGLYDVILPETIVMKGSRVICNNKWSKSIKKKLTETQFSYFENNLFTSEQPVSTTEQRNLIMNTFQTCAVDMEAGFVISIANKRHVPCAVLKIISDTTAYPDISKHMKGVAKKIKEVVVLLLQNQNKKFLSA